MLPTPLKNIYDPAMPLHYSYLFSKLHIRSQNGGQSIVVLASIQSGYSQDTGARCNEVEGYYTDEEINIQAQGVLSWIRDEVTQLEVIQELR